MNVSALIPKSEGKFGFHLSNFYFKFILLYVISILCAFQRYLDPSGVVL